jgi:hypothetical protein
VTIEFAHMDDGEGSGPQPSRCPSCGLSPYESGIGDSDISRIVAEFNWTKGIAADAIAEANRCRKALREIAEADAKTPVLTLNRIAERALGS